MTAAVQVRRKESRPLTTHCGHVHFSSLVAVGHDLPAPCSSSWRAAHGDKGHDFETHNGCVVVSLGKHSRGFLRLGCASSGTGNSEAGLSMTMFWQKVSS